MVIPWLTKTTLQKPFKNDFKKETGFFAEKLITETEELNKRFNMIVLKLLFSIIKISKLHNYIKILADIIKWDVIDKHVNVSKFALKQILNGSLLLEFLLLACLKTENYK